MKTNIKIFLVLAVAFFIVPIFGQTAFADAKVYEDIADGKHPISIKALHEKKDEESAMKDYIDKNATLHVTDGKVKLILTINSQKYVTGFQVEGNNAVEKKVSANKENRNETFNVNELTQILDAQVQYEVPGVLKGDHKLRLSLGGLDKLPVAEQVEDEPVVEEEESDETTEEETEEPEEESNEREEGTLVQNADEIHSIEYVSDMSLDRYFDNPVKLLHKDGKKYIQINGNSAQYIKSLTINGNEVTWGKIQDDNTYVVQFEVKDPSAELAFGMTIDTGEHGPGIMKHDAKLSFDEETQKLIQGPKEENDNRVEGILVKEKDADEVYSINYESDEMDRLKDRFDNPVTLLYKNGKKYIQMSGNQAKYIKSLTINGKEVTWVVIQDDNDGFVIQFEIDSLSKKLELGMVIDTGNPQMGVMTPTAMLSFDESTKKLVRGSKEETEKPVEKPSKKPEKDKNASLTPDKAYNINYVIKHEDGVKDSVANDFFTGKAILLEKDGKTYVQMTITNGDMVKGLSNKYGEALIVKKNKDGSIVVQLRVDNDLANSLIDMSIVVPGLYSSDHTAQLVFDKDSKKERGVKGLALVGTDNPDNTSGPTVEEGSTVVKPEFGEGQKENNGTNAVKSGKGVNPQTGDTTNIILFALLLIGSAVPLVVQARRRFN